MDLEPRSAPNTRQTDAVVAKLRSLATEHGIGSRLPSVRALMRMCSVSQNVVVQALDQLESEGVLERRARSGIFVSAEFRLRPRLILCEPRLFLGPSAFGELLLNALISPFLAQPEQIELVFTKAALWAGPTTLDAHLPFEVRARMRSGRYGSVLALGFEGDVCAEIEALGLPCITFASASRLSVQTAALEACTLAVAELSRQGCRRLALSNTPWLSAREVFLAATAAHHVDEMVVPLDEPFEAELYTGLVREFRMQERGRRGALRALGPEVPPHQRPDALVSLDDTYTMGFIHGMIELGLRPQVDLSIATYTNKRSPALASFEDCIVQMQFDPAESAAALHEAASALERGEPLPPSWTSSGFDPQRGQCWTYFVRPKLIVPPGMDTNLC
jgi:hypothetical protein